MTRKKGTPRKSVTRRTDDALPAARQPSHFVGLGNQGATCYLNSLLQAFYLTPEFRAGLYALSAHEVANQKVLRSLQQLFARLQLLDAHWVSTGGVTEAFNWGAEDALVQHDVQELTRILLDVLEKQLAETSQAELVRSVFGGTLLYQTTCADCGRVSSREEAFMDLSVGIADTLLEGLNAELADEQFCGEDQYMYFLQIRLAQLGLLSCCRCDGCNRKVDAVRRTQISQLPQVLTLSLKRFQYDQVLQQRKKVQKRSSFPMELDLSSLSQQSESVRYSCTAVVIHRGDAQSGHYHAYIQDHSGQGNWYAPRPGGPSPGSTVACDAESDEPLAALMSLLEQCGRCRVSILADQFSEHIGSSWEELFAERFGPLEEFISAHNSHFELVGASSDGLAPSVQLRTADSPASDSDGWTHVGGAAAEAAAAEGLLLEGSNWFDFDDVDVNPIVDSTLESTFGGAEAAYMLLYRRIPEGTQPHEASSFGQVPNALREEVLAESDALVAARASSRPVRALLVGVSATVRHGVLHSGLDDPPETLCVPQQGGLCAVADLRQAVAEWLGGGTQFVLYELKPVLAVEHCWHAIRNLENDDDRISVDTVVVDVGGGMSDVLIGAENSPLMLRYFMLSAQSGGGNLQQLVLRQNTTVAEFCKILQDETGIKPAKQLLHLWQSSQKKGPPTPITTQQSSTRLSELGLSRGCEISIEVQDSATAEPLALTEFARRRENLSLAVRLSAASGVAVQLSLSKAATIEDVKREAFRLLEKQQQVDVSHPIELTRLRQLPAGGRFELGMLLLDERIHLRNAALSNRASLILELFALPPRGSVVLQWYHRTVGWNYETRSEGNSRKSELFELEIECVCSLGELRRRMASCLQLDENQVRLRRATADEQGTPGVLLGHDDLTVEESLLVGNELLCLEDGAPVVKGELTVRVHLLSGEVRHLEGSNCTTQSAGSCDFVHTLSVKDTSSLAGLKAQLLTAAPFQAALAQLSAARGGGSYDDQEWHECAEDEVEFHEAHEQPAEPPSLRIQLHPSAQVLRSEGGALKDQPRAVVSQAAALAVSLLPGPERLSTNNSALLHAALRSKTGVYGPTLSVTVDSGATALSSTVVIDALSTAFGIAPENLLLAKREAPPRWRVLRQQEKKKGKSKGSKGVIPNVTKAPWNVGDGSFIALKDLSKEPKDCEEDFFSLEDLAAFPALNRSDSSKSLSSLQSEVSLSINVGDF